MKIRRVLWVFSLVSAGLFSVLSPARTETTESSAPKAEVEPKALEALQRMSGYLQTLKSFELKADATMDQVFENGQKLQFGAQVHYKVRRPDGFVIDLVTDRKSRRFFYDGKTFTLSAPNLGLYAGVPAPSTIAEVLQVLDEQYDIYIPMTDLFRWSDPTDKRAEDLISGVYVGYAKIGDRDCDQYAFREASVDWQVWIARGDHPLPLKMVITSTMLDAAPQFVSNLTWTENPEFDDEDFAFKPAEGNSAIQLSQGME